jgi:hypothetical protein
LKWFSTVFLRQYLTGGRMNEEEKFIDLILDGLGLSPEGRIKAKQNVKKQLDRYVEKGESRELAMLRIFNYVDRVSAMFKREDA